MSDDASGAARADTDRLAAALERQDPAGEVRPAGPGDAVDGVRPQVVARPTSVAGVSALLAEAASQGLAAVARGGGTALDWAAPPERAGLLLETAGLDRLVEHEAGDLVAVAEAGLPVAALLETVGRSGQELVVDLPPSRLAGGSTVGGTLATGSSGPRRLQRGALRDLVLGATVVLADGTVAASGGKVVKNVAGYDLAKLMTGSYGTLGVIVRAAFRLHPVRPARRWVVATGDPADVATRARDVVTSQLAPAAVELDRSAWSREATVAVLLEGQEAAVVARAREAAALTGGEVVSTPPEWWAALPDDGAGVLGSGEGRPADGVLVKATATLTGVVRLLEAARAAEDTHGAGVAVRGTAAGVLYVAIGPSGGPGGAVAPGGVTASGGSDPAAVAGVVHHLRAAAPSPRDGTVTVLRAPRAVRAAVDAWGPVAGLDLMRAIKHRLDPGRNLAPGRFVGGI
ncbi:FAD-binding oxidoreductase [Myceligenerans indicum]|uniref:FAD-binding oxidoreductase n=1 Tax=Myceligenerans indicum TaxID=2593663 RepID=A0ABS1LGF5_9MICO|nr:FAD-binding oxidoreductase [Myceligenerans indicum]MBL0885315.1 FAD-binding oxidoreductase [Myceligenerans indicum]